MVGMNHAQIPAQALEIIELEMILEVLLMKTATMIAVASKDVDLILIGVDMMIGGMTIVS